MSLDAARVNTLHEQRDEVGLATEMQVLRRGQPGSVKDPRVRDRLATILGTVSNYEVDSCIDVIDCDVSVLVHALNLRPSACRWTSLSIGMVFGRGPYSPRGACWRG